MDGSLCAHRATISPQHSALSCQWMAVANVTLAHHVNMWICATGVSMCRPLAGLCGHHQWSRDLERISCTSSEISTQLEDDKLRCCLSSCEEMPCVRQCQSFFGVNEWLILLDIRNNLEQSVRTSNGCQMDVKVCGTHWHVIACAKSLGTVKYDDSSFGFMTNSEVDSSLWIGEATPEALWQFKDDLCKDNLNRLLNCCWQTL